MIPVDERAKKRKRREDERGWMKRMRMGMKTKERKRKWGNINKDSCNCWTFLSISFFFPSISFFFPFSFSLPFFPSKRWWWSWWPVQMMMWSLWLQARSNEWMMEGKKRKKKNQKRTLLVQSRGNESCCITMILESREREREWYEEELRGERVGEKFLKKRKF